MKAGITSSVVLHATLLGFGLVSLSAPKPFEVTNVESLPVEIIPMEALAQTIKGDKKAPLAEKPAPSPTKRPDIVPDARQVGENSADTEAPPTPVAKPKPVETAALPPPSPKPELKPKPEEPKPAPVKLPDPKPAEAPATEVTPVATPKQEVKPDPVSEAIEAEQPDAEAVKLPESAPAPEAKPQTAKAETAKAPDRKDTEKPVKQAAAKAESTEKQFNEDEVAALLNKDKPSGGGAKRSTETAALGGKRTSGEKLSRSEMGALSDQLGNCWTIPVGSSDSEGLRVSIKFRLDITGKLDGRPEVESTSGNRQFDESAVRAVQKCDRDGLMVPEGKQEVWAEVIVNFDPTEMF